MTAKETEPTRSPLSSCTCRRCSRKLTNPSSVKQGYGKTCYHKRMKGDPKQSSKFAEACTIVAPDLAKKVYAAIYRLVAKNEKYLDQTAHWECRFCHTTLLQMPVESMDHDSGLIMPGFGKPQWFILHDEHYDLAIWKIGITSDKILDEMEEHGDIPKGWTRKKV